MEKAAIIEKIKNAVVSVVRHEDFEMKDELTASQVSGWDSLSHMLIIAELEKVFNIKFKLKELNKLVNMGSLIQTIESKLTA
jgi:acyl carrier protein